MGYKEQLTTVLEISAGLAAIAFLSQFAFSSKTRKQILERDDYTCQETGRKQDDGWFLQAAHLNHNKNHPFYDDPSMGLALCVAAHLQQHLDHVGQAHEIGLTEQGNQFAIMKLQQTDEVLWGYKGVPIEPDGSPALHHINHIANRLDYSNGNGSTYKDKSLEQLNLELFG